MFFLLPIVTVALLAVFGVLGVLRAWRQRHGPLRSARPTAGSHPAALVPASLLRGADRTWVVFSTPDCVEGRQIAALLRSRHPGTQVSEVDCTERPDLAARFDVRRHPTVLLANRYGQVEDRVVGSRSAARRAGRPA